MYFDDSTVERKNICIETDHLLLLESFEKPFKHAVFTPAAHAGINAVPLAKTALDPSPFASMFNDIQHCVQHYGVINSDIASLRREDVGYFFVLLFIAQQ